MSSVSGIRDGEFDRLSIIQDLGVGLDRNFGTNGQVLTSAGEGESLFWGSNSSTLPENLVKGNNITFTASSGEVTTFNGSVETTISATNTTYQADLGVEIDTTTTPETIKAKVDSDAQPTLRNDYNSDELAVLRVPNNLTVNLGLEYQTGTSYDGSAQRTIQTKVDSTTIDNQGGTGFDELNVKKVPNTLTITDSAGTSVVYDGSATKSITINDDNTEYTGTAPIDVNNTTDVISLNKDDTLTTITDNLSVVKVPNSITFVTDGTGSRTGTFDGSGAITIDNRDSDTTYTAGNGIQISGSNQIQTKTDNQTIRDSGGGSGNNLEVIKVPNSITFVTDGTGSRTGTFDGSGAITIDNRDSDTTYTATAPIDITSEVISLNKDATLTTISNNLSVVKVPNALTITKTDGTDVVFDGTSPESITLTTDTGITTLNEGNGISITSQSATEKTISARVDSDAQPTLRNDYNSNELQVLRVPNNLTVNLGLEYQTGTSYDGSFQRTLVTKVDDTTPSTQTISNTSGSGFDELRVIRVPQKLTAGTNITFSQTSSPTTAETEYDGSTAITIKATDTQLNLIEGNGISIATSGDDRTISVNADGTTLNNNVGSGQAGVIKVPNTLTITQGAVSTVFDGSSAKTVSIASGTADHSVVSRLGQSSTISTFTTPHTSVTPTLTTGMTGIAGLGIEGMTAVSTDYEVSVDFLMTQEARSGVQTAESYIRLDRIANSQIVGWGSANGVYAPIKIQSGSASNSLITRAFYGRLSYKWVISNLSIGTDYNFIPRFTTYASSSSGLTKMAIQYGGTQGFATVTATPIQINTPSGMSEQADDY